MGVGIVVVLLHPLTVITVVFCIPLPHLCLSACQPSCWAVADYKKKDNATLSNVLIINEGDLHWWI